MGRKKGLPRGKAMQVGDDPRRNVPENAGEPVPEPVLDAGIPTELAVARAAMYWEHSRYPKNPAVRVALRVRRKNPKEFIANWQKLEQDFRESGGGTPVASAVKINPGEPNPSERVECPVTERIVGEMEAWLERKRLAAVERAQKIERGEKA